MADDPEVIQAVLVGDVERYAELVERYQPACWKLAYSFIGNMEDAKDVSQNGFIKAYKNLKYFKGRSKFSTWLYRIVANECKDFLKKKRIKSVPIDSSGEEDESVIFEVEDASSGPDKKLEDRELALRLQESISRLKGNQRKAFVLHHLNGFSLEEVAGIMCCRAGTVKSHLHRACESLRIQMALYISG